MLNFKVKKLLSVFSVSILLLSFVLPYVNNESYLAATAVAESTSKKKTVGHKMEGAEYYDELWDKFSVIAIDNGGGSGEGGGAGDNNASNAGNNGNYNDAGGTFGQAAGVGTGTGNQQNQGGVGSGSTGGYTGSAAADALRAIKAKAEKEREESIAKVLETASDKQAARESITKRESIEASIQKRLQQESIKAKIAAEEKSNQYETPVYVESTTRKKTTYDIKKETNVPTSEREISVNDNIEHMLPSATEKKDIYDSNHETVVAEEITISDYEPGDFIENTEAKSKVDKDVKETVSAPTSEKKDEYDTTASSESNNDETTVVDEESTEKKLDNETEEGKGSKGGKDAEADEDQMGEAGQNESEGNAENKGKYQLETEGDYAGKKVFDLERNGNLGLDPEHLSVTNMKGFVTSTLILLFSLGALVFILSTRDKKSSKNYF